MPIPYAMSLPDLLNRVCTESGSPFISLEAGDSTGTTLALRFTQDDTEKSLEQISSQRLASDSRKPRQHLTRTVSRSHDVEHSALATRLLHRRFLVASITKPIVAMAFLKLVADGCVTLTERIGDHLPEFRKSAFRRITFRHLLTHTSGLPDMLPNNAELRAAHASLDDFRRQASGIEPEFAVGTDCRYSSVGFLLLGAVVKQHSGRPLAEYLHEHFFAPLGMHNTWLGLPEEHADELMPTVLPSHLPTWQPDADDWGWNSRYWRTLGAPWGGLISTAADLGRYARMILRGGTTDEGISVIPGAVVTAAMTNQTDAVCALPETVRRVRPWAFGWRRQWPDHQASFSDFVSSETVGHWGATGTLFWIDAVAKAYCVILTTTPYEQSRVAIQRLSNEITCELSNHWSRS